MLTMPRSETGRRAGDLRRRRAARITVAGLAVAVAATGLAFWVARSSGTTADANDPALVAEGRAVYDQRCASCHGAHLEGQPNWQERLPNGRLPAPPHDASGHTWHHPDRQLFEITKHGASGLVPGYQSDMPGFAGVLSDRQIWAVLAYIKSTWPPDIRARQETVDRAAQQSAAK
jgi:mono/diheme cytochrome c family protein